MQTTTGRPWPRRPCPSSRCYGGSSPTRPAGGTTRAPSWRGRTGRPSGRSGCSPPWPGRCPGGTPRVRTAGGAGRPVPAPSLGRSCRRRRRSSCRPPRGPGGTPPGAPSGRRSCPCCTTRGRRCGGRRPRPPSRSSRLRPRRSNVTTRGTTWTPSGTPGWGGGGGTRPTSSGSTATGSCPGALRAGGAAGRTGLTGGGGSSTSSASFPRRSPAPTTSGYGSSSARLASRSWARGPSRRTRRGSAWHASCRASTTPSPGPGRRGGRAGRSCRGSPPGRSRSSSRTVPRRGEAGGR
mmetsp:Transcript_23219/g.53307  ORF Transcript_23219/g.53307 Transcript_23219/m.53307 type:complete len:294 (+) Transcript_23219:405-1286(+)